MTQAPNANETGLFTYTLTNSSKSVSGDLPEIVIDLSHSNLNRIKQNTLLATSENDTYIYITDLTIIDTFGNAVVEILSSEAQQTSVYVGDMASPKLTGFDLDMNAGISLSASVRLSILQV